MYGDAEWAQGYIDSLSPLRTPSTEILELRAAGVPEARIRALYPKLEIREYVPGVLKRLNSVETWVRISSTLLLSQSAELLNLLPHSEREANDAAIASAANDLLDVLLALPKQNLPPQLIVKPESHFADTNALLGLCEQLFSGLIVLGYIAAEDESFTLATSHLDLRVPCHRLRHLAQRLIG